VPVTIEFAEVVEAAIGIEPMNKGFADRLSPYSLNAIECHTGVIID